MQITVLKELPIYQRFTPIYEDIQIVFDTIREERFEPTIDHLRAYYNTNKAQYDNLKKQLPVCLFSGIFSDFANDKLITSSNLIVLDFDKIPDANEVLNQKNQFKSDPYTFAVFVSPSGYGLKVIVKVDNNIDNTTHNEYLAALKGYYNSPYWDDNGKGISRACFISSDKDIYVNTNCQIWTKRVQNISKSFSTPNSQQPKSVIPQNRVGKYILYLEKGWTNTPMILGKRHNSSYARAIDMAEWGISEDDAYDYLSQFIDPSFPDWELKKEVSNAYGDAKSKNRIGIKYKLLP